MKTIIVDDHEMVREGLQGLLERDGMNVLATFPDSKGVLDFLDSNYIDVAIVDMTLSYVNEGVDLCISIKKKHPEVNVIVLSMHANAEFVSEAFVAGANSYVYKHNCGNELIDVMKMVGKGDSYFAGDVLDRLREGMSIPRENFSRSIEKVSLSNREKEILRLIASDHTSSEIASILKVEETTVNTHRKNLISKTGVKSSLGLVRFAVENGFLAKFS